MTDIKTIIIVALLFGMLIIYAIICHRMLGWVSCRRVHWLFDWNPPRERAELKQ